MDYNEILAIAAQSIAIIFAVILGVILILSMKKDGKFTADEAAKVVLMGLLIYMTVVNATRDTEWLVFDQGTYLIVLGAVLGLAGLDIYKSKGLLNGDSRKNNTDGK